MGRSRFSLVSLTSLVLVIVLSGCASAQTKSNKSSSSGSRPKTDCMTCNRMCEVGGDASKSKSVDKCKADCASKCK
jgi:hypothetical protein